MGNKKKRINTELLTAVEVYKLVLSGELKAFPAYFWSETDGKDNAREVTRYLFEEILSWSPEDIKKKFKHEVMKRYKLDGMYLNCFGQDLFQVVDNAYPGIFRPWEMAKKPHDFWTDENCRLAMKWLFEEKLEIDTSNPMRKIESDDFKDNGLSGMLNMRFKNQPFKAVEFMYPGKFREWEITKTVKGFWTLENAASATRWLFEEKLKWSDQEIMSRVTSHTFSENGLKGMMAAVFEGSPFYALENAYPGRFKETDLPYLPSGYWTKERCIEAVRDLFENKLRWTREDIINNFSNKVFNDNGLFSVLRVYRRGVEAVLDAYPGEFREWEFLSSKNVKWTRGKAVEAVKWLIEERLKWNDDDVKKINRKVFLENNLYGALIHFRSSPVTAVMEAYPGRYKAWEFMRVPRGFWNREKGIEATRWLAEEKLKLSKDEILNGMKQSDFQKYKLLGMLLQCFEGSKTEALKATYPDLFK